jgi:hypothetical protein
MSKATKFVARYAGKIVGTRRSPRPYTHAVITQAVEEYARAAAYDWQPADSDKSNFEWLTFKATCTAGAEVLPPGWKFSTKFSADEIESARAEIAGDWASYVTRTRARKIAFFEQRKAEGAFEPAVGGWSMSGHNAAKMAASFKHPGVRFLAIVPAEVSQ